MPLGRTGRLADEARWLSARAAPVPLARGRIPGPGPRAPARSRAVVRGADPVQWATAGATAAETAKVEPATAAAIRVGLWASADVTGDRF